MAEGLTPSVLIPPAVAALKGEAAGQGPVRGQMERSISMDIREEREELREAAEQCLNVIMDLGLDNHIRWVSPTWRDVVGTEPDAVVGKPIAHILLSDKDAFSEAVEAMRKDDSRSRIIRFATSMGPLSVLQPKSHKTIVEGEDAAQTGQVEEQDRVLNLEAQGIIVYDRTSGEESHTMWMIRPSVIREVTIDLPQVLVESLGIGAEMLAHYLTALAEAGTRDPESHPPPLPALCRICERQITPWWFEKHTELCLLEHKAEMDVQLAQESLTDHRNAIVKVLDVLEAQSRQSRSLPVEVASPVPIPEYKGLPISPASTPSSGPSSGRASPASPPSRSRERPGGFGHHRARSFAIRRPVSRIVELVLDLCDTALEINTPAIKDSRGQLSTEIRTQSPQSESRISQILQWQSPSAGSLEAEQGLALLCDDTSRLARAKVEAVFRHRRILEYSERIRVEFDILVQECIDAAMRKAASIVAGEDSDSSADIDQVGGEEIREELGDDGLDRMSTEEGVFSGSFDSPAILNPAIRSTSTPSLTSRTRRRPSSAAESTRSSSPRGSQTPRSNAGAMSIVPHSKRASMVFESDAGGDSDTSVRSSVLSGPPRTDSPGSELGLTRIASSRERKRKSLILPSVMSSRQQSPARGAVPPSSPLRLSKPRVSSGTDHVPSPIVSPVMPLGEFSPPSISAAQLHHHRRQSSAVGGEFARAPASPRLASITAPQPRAVPPSIKDFEIIKPISKGAFGSVYLSKKKSTGDYFAIKVLKKADMVAKNQVTNVKAERAIMMWQGESDFVAKLYWTFSSKDYLYLVMEYLNGGDCASLIKVLGSLPEDWAKKYIAEVVLGVEHLHSRGIIHRDLKPDNLLIDQKGHLKLTDFGLSRMGLIGRQKRALNSKPDEPAPDLLKQGPFHRAMSVASSRSASFDMQGNHSPAQTPSLTPALTGDIGQPSYFSLSRETSASREPSRRTSGNRSDSGESDALQAMFRRFSIADDLSAYQRRSPIEEESYSEDGYSPDPYMLQPILSQTSSVQNNTPPQASTMLPPPMALYDPGDSNRRFVGTPDYLAPETINGAGQDETSDWWSLGCILFEFLYGYPPFHADAPDQVFQNILDRKIDWPEEDVCEVSAEAKDLMNRLMCSNPRDRLGANAGEKFSCGGEEIRSHEWFVGINWQTLRDDEASFVPATCNPEDTEYFDARGATYQNFASEFEDQCSSPAATPGADYPDRPHDALSRVRSQVNSMKRGLMPLHIPPHVREGRTRRLSEPVAADDFGNFAFKNLPVLEKANKDVIQKLRAEAMQGQSKPSSAVTSPIISSPSPSLESSPLISMPLKRTMSANKGANRPVSPSLVSQVNSSPSRVSQPSSPLLVSFSTGQNHERRKTSNGSSTLSHQTSGSSLQPGSFFDVPRLPGAIKAASSASSPIKLLKTQSMIQPPSGHGLTVHRQSSASINIATSPRARSMTVGSQEEDTLGNLRPNHHHRRSQVLDVSPSSSDTEDSRQKVLLRVQRRRQSMRRLSQITLAEGPIFRPLDVLICEDHPVSRLVMEKLLEKLRCRTISVQTGAEAIRYASGQVKFDIIFMEFRLPQINGADVARMIRETKNANSHTPIVTVTGYLKELQAPQYFDGYIEKPPTMKKLTEIMGRLCQWKAPPPNWTPAQLPIIPSSGLRQESVRTDDSPTTSNSSGFAAMPSSSYRGSSREDSIGSSSYGDMESRGGDDIPGIISRRTTNEWSDREIARMLGGLGISEEPTTSPELKSLNTVPSILGPEQSSAPAVMSHSVPRRQRSSEEVDSKRRSLEAKRYDCAESGDDEDEELGHLQVRAKSPKGRSKPSSKLGTEMMRTNSHGSVISVEEMSAADGLASSPPPAIAEDSTAEALTTAKQDPKQFQPLMSPPEIFPLLPGCDVQEIDMDPNAVTPKPSHTNYLDPDPTPTAKRSMSPTQRYQ
ncbi:AGC protein kinase [Coniosporium apollinis CBS 100218]|uniref:non-specific serine/threonine protein kinase n=1 Tax=Coniosporium apollinis (strain CBS 100218) TaxID=1168221 RepID=R7YJ96_CONA1|nr:AGC protein kinase [Coniosporium apollinis CBS 100218]EON61997.1 AGC protein kinase [Coniosporium apollinis CBS 100218]